MPLNPHNWLTRLTPVLPWPLQHHPADVIRWRCQYCGAEGTWEELHAVACSYVYPPCESCGQTPECALDCPGIAAALAEPGVYIVGTIHPKPKA